MGILNSLEVRNEGTNSITDSGTLSDLLAGRNGTFAGEAVTTDAAYGVAGIWAAINLLSGSVGQIPIVLYQREGDNKVRVPKHPVAKLLRKPNPQQTSFGFRQYTQAARGVYGRSFSFINRARGIPRELMPIHPNRVVKGLDSMGRPIYKVDNKVHTADEILEINWSDWTDRNGVVQGLGPIQKAREAAGIAIAADRHTGMMFANGAAPAGILTREGQRKIDKEKIKLIKESWDTAFGGSKKFSTAVLDGGWTWSPITMNSKDAQFIEQRQFSVEEIGRMFGVPSSMINDNRRSTFSNSEQQALGYVVNSLMPHLKEWEEKLTQSLLTEKEQETMFLEFLVEGLLRGDFKSRFDGYGLAVQNRIMNPNEVRAKENLNSYEGGDEFINPNIEQSRSPEDQS